MQRLVENLEDLLDDHPRLGQPDQFGQLAHVGADRQKPDQRFEVLGVRGHLGQGGQFETEEALLEPLEEARAQGVDVL